MRHNANNVRDYLKVIPEDRSYSLKTIIDLFKTIAPKVSESFQHGMPFYDFNKKHLFAIASQKHYISVYITETNIIDKYRDLLGTVNFGKNCIRFKKLEHINLEILEKVITESYLQRVNQQ